MSEVAKAAGEYDEKNRDIEYMDDAFMAGAGWLLMEARKRAAVIEFGPDQLRYVLIKDLERLCGESK